MKLTWRFLVALVALLLTLSGCGAAASAPGTETSKPDLTPASTVSATDLAVTPKVAEKDGYCGIAERSYVPASIDFDAVVAGGKCASDTSALIYINLVDGKAQFACVKGNVAAFCHNVGYVNRP